MSDLAPIAGLVPAIDLPPLTREAMKGLADHYLTEPYAGGPNLVFEPEHDLWAAHSEAALQIWVERCKSARTPAAREASLAMVRRIHRRRVDRSIGFTFPSWCSDGIVRAMEWAE